jgi:hypothetical protein
LVDLFEYLKMHGTTTNHKFEKDELSQVNFQDIRLRNDGRWEFKPRNEIDRRTERSITWYTTAVRDRETLTALQH